MAEPICCATAKLWYCFRLKLISVGRERPSRACFDLRKRLCAWSKMSSGRPQTPLLRGSARRHGDEFRCKRTPASLLTRFPALFADAFEVELSEEALQKIDAIHLQSKDPCMTL